MQRTAEALEEEIAADEHHYSEPLDTLSPAKILDLGIDGTGIPLRADGGAGKTADGAKTREVKFCTVSSAEYCDDEGIPIRDEGSVKYTAAMEGASPPDYERVWRA